MRPPAVPLADKRKAPTAEQVKRRREEEEAVSDASLIASLIASDRVPHQVQRRREEEEAVSVSLRKLEKKLDPRGAGGDRGDSSSEEVADCV